MLEIFTQDLFPIGIANYALGGLFIGLGISIIYALTGMRAGASRFFTTSWSYFSRKKYFHKEKIIKQRQSRLVLSLGLIIGAIIFTIFFNNQEIFITEISKIRLFLGGILVGFGTALSKGCTSGHGICGTASFEKTPILATITFVFTAIGVALIIKSLGIFI